MGTKINITVVHPKIKKLQNNLSWEVPSMEKS
jgi:hypothetical protein